MAFVWLRLGELLFVVAVVTCDLAASLVGQFCFSGQFQVTGRSGERLDGTSRLLVVSPQNVSYSRYFSYMIVVLQSVF